MHISEHMLPNEALFQIQYMIGLPGLVVAAENLQVVVDLHNAGVFCAF